MRGLNRGVARFTFQVGSVFSIASTGVAHALRADAGLQSAAADVPRRPDHALMLEHKRDKRSGRSLIAFVFRKGFAHPHLLDPNLEHEGQQRQGDREDAAPLADGDR